MKQTYYFSHDYNAREDDKIQSLLFKHGLMGYGAFWAIVEMLYSNEGFMRTDYDRIAYVLRTQSDIIKSVVEDFGLFHIADDQFTSRSILNRLNAQKSKSKKAQNAAKIKWKKHHANALRLQCDRNAIKESKVKENKINNITPYNPPRGFEEFWKNYPKKVGRKKCEKIWVRMSAEEKTKALQVLPQHLKHEQWVKENGAFIPHPATWLNQGRWDDEIAIEQLSEAEREAEVIRRIQNF